MRKALFAIVLVAASFSGGAVMNGPGLRWVKDMVLNQPGTEIATTTLGDPPTDADASTGQLVAPVGEIPSAPIPPLYVPPASPEGSLPTTSPATPRSESKFEPVPPAPDPPRSPEKPPTHRPLASTSIPTAAASPPALEPPAPLSTSKEASATVRPMVAPAPVDPDLALASLAPDNGNDSGPPRLETAMDPVPAPVSTPTPKPTPTPMPLPAPDPRGSGAGDWGAIRGKMRELGVSRYGIEGEPGGRVRFHCVIPLAGRRAVGQQFEAEGDDEIDAAQAALRRVALWRATEHPGP